MSAERDGPPLSIAPGIKFRHLLLSLCGVSCLIRADPFCRCAVDLSSPVERRVHPSRRGAFGFRV